MVTQHERSEHQVHSSINTLVGQMYWHQPHKPNYIYVQISVLCNANISMSMKTLSLVYMWVNWITCISYKRYVNNHGTVRFIKITDMPIVLDYKIYSALILYFIFYIYVDFLLTWWHVERVFDEWIYNQSFGSNFELLNFDVV